ncbi:unnamed protein product [Phytophthora lilii]|uniref:Unnamed protein product n=1 Tax=Phytophthora lilii TaxID=2077276 RepID=A0A9W7CNC7_9STRA|nr:unnamed protein product [Phytophthora lilii]
MSFQFNGFGSQSSPAAPRFAVPTVVAPPAGTEGEKGEESDEEEDGLQLKQEEKTVEKAVQGEEEEEEDDELKDQVQEKTQEKTENEEVPEVKKVTEEVSEKVELEKQELWTVDESMNGIEVMSNAFINTVQPSLDATLHRIAELKESQQRLLKMLVEQNAGLKSNKQLEDAAVVLEKLPFYAKKLQGIKLAMQEISTSTEKMKRRTEGLRIDAQSCTYLADGADRNHSHLTSVSLRCADAIKKENKRDAQSQWNKLYAAKSAPGSSAQS